MLFLKHLLVGLAAAAWLTGLLIALPLPAILSITVDYRIYLPLVVLAGVFAPMAIMFGWIYLKSRSFKTS